MNDHRVIALAEDLLATNPLALDAHTESLADAIQAAVDKWMENHSNVTTD